MDLFIILNIFLYSTISENKNDLFKTKYIEKCFDYYFTIYSSRLISYLLIFERQDETSVFHQVDQQNENNVFFATPTNKAFRAEKVSP